MMDLEYITPNIFYKEKHIRLIITTEAFKIKLDD